MQGDVGFPDLVLARGGRVVFMELKSQRGVVSAAQRRWIDALQGSGHEAFVVRPSDWPSISTLLESHDTSKDPA
jgi:hypothetical protein